MFHSWAAGTKPDTGTIRKVLSPLFAEVEKKPGIVFVLNKWNKKEEYLYHHAVAVALLAYSLARKLGLPKKECLQAGMAGVLCDAGMSQLSPSLLYNKGFLSEKEMKELHKHPTYSYKMLKETPGISNHVLLAVLQHHERENGSGYPLGVTEANIHTLSRVVAVADVYHAMTSERLYRKRQLPFQVIEEMAKKQFGKLHAETISILMDAFLAFALNTSVLLSNGETAEIVFIDQKEITTPFVRKKDSQDVFQVGKEEGLHISDIIVK
nr:HD domain-containing phosphohydrolase [Bacillus piscicola]